MIKVTITLPSGVQITVESEEAGVAHEVVVKLLQDWPRDLLHPIPAANGAAAPVPLPERGGDWPLTPAVEPQVGLTTAQPAKSPGVAVQAAPVWQPPSSELFSRDYPGDDTDDSDEELSEEELEFAEFCQAANPVGDMRRVVVAAEGAKRFLGQPSIDAEGLEVLFLLVGWPPAHNFTQTIRNSARTKFRWLERVPGRAGHYIVSDIGRHAIGLNG